IRNHASSQLISSYHLDELIVLESSGPAKTEKQALVESRRNTRKKASTTPSTLSIASTPSVHNEHSATLPDLSQAETADSVASTFYELKPVEPKKIERMTALSSADPGQCVEPRKVATKHASSAGGQGQRKLSHDWNA
uniref:C2 domain-containing protein n=1 Tax=Mesocestoides corti TaxID=53468 RepID=A0A5K3F0S6_MESCO